MINYYNKYIRIFIIVRVKQILQALPFFKDKKYTPFLIIGHPRTGTSLLHTYLNSHPGILSLNELLANDTDKNALFGKFSLSIKAVGFKYFYEYILEENKKALLGELLAAKKIKVLKIDRKDFFRTFVSLRIAEKTNQWSNSGDQQVGLKKKQMMLTAEECIAAFENYEKAETETMLLLKQFNIPVLEIDYDELDNQPEATLIQVQQFLGVKKKKLFTLLAKQNPEEITDLVVNYLELKQELSGTKWELLYK